MAQLVTTHPLDPKDAPVAATFRAMVSGAKGVRLGVEARGQFDAQMEQVSPRDDVRFEEDSVGGIPGVWIFPAHSRLDEAIIHLHGGWFNFGSAKAYRHLVAHIAALAQTRTFVPDYRRAPEDPFPAASDDSMACYRALAKSGFRRIALTGDSAGGNLALVTGARLLGINDGFRESLVGIAVLSPVTDLSLSGASYETRANADPLFTREQVSHFIESYLGVAEPSHPWASPLLGRFDGMPPIRIHVGDDEVLLDDSLRYAERAAAAGVDVSVDVWMGMPHGFPSSIGKFNAASLALDAVGAFLIERLQADAHSARQSL